MNPFIIVGIAGAIAVVIVVVGIVLTRRQENLIEVRLGDIDNLDDDFGSFDTGDSGSNEESSQRSALEDGRKLLDPLNERLAEGKFGQKWRKQLARANLKLTVAEFAVIHVVSIAAFFTVGYVVLFSQSLPMSVLAGIIGFFAPRIYVGRTVGKRLVDFETQLPDTLGLWVNALRSGYSVLQAMEAIAKDAPEPTKTEFQRVVQEVQLGIDMPDALEHLLERVESDDLDLVITAVNIQREVGGNLAEILEVIGSTIRERIKLKGEIRVLTSQGRITGYLISFLPIGLAMFLNAASPSYMGQLFENRACGWPMIGAGLTLIGIGTAVIQKIVDIEI